MSIINAFIYINSSSKPHTRTYTQKTRLIDELSNELQRFTSLWLFQQGQCRFQRDLSVVNITSWAILPARDERALEIAVATIGPIAASINASPRTFQLYQWAKNVLFASRKEKRTEGGGKPMRIAANKRVTYARIARRRDNFRHLLFIRWSPGGIARSFWFFLDPCDSSKFIYIEKLDS